MTLAVNDYVEIANALCELSTLDTLGNCDSFNINKKDETRRQFRPVQDRQDKVSEFSLSRIIVSNHYFSQQSLEKFPDRADAVRKGDKGENFFITVQG